MKEKTAIRQSETFLESFRLTLGVVVWGHVCPLWVPGVGVVQNIAGGLVTVRHITSKYMWEHDLGPFLPCPGSYPAIQCLWLKQDQNGRPAPGHTVPPGKCHIQIHGRAWFRAIFALSRNLSRVPGVQNTFQERSWRLYWGGVISEFFSPEIHPNWTIQLSLRWPLIMLILFC